jgi:transcription initiation factor TFIIH subunit 2
VPKYGTREVVIIYGGLTTCDPGDIYETIDTIKKENIKVSVIGLSAEIHICKAIAEATGGWYTQKHTRLRFFRDLLCVIK